MAAGMGKARRAAAAEEVLITWKHLVKALDATQASIDVDERQAIKAYLPRICGRPEVREMRDGQGSMEGWRA